LVEIGTVVSEEKIF